MDSQQLSDEESQLLPGSASGPGACGKPPARASGSAADGNNYDDHHEADEGSMIRFLRSRCGLESTLAALDAAPDAPIVIHCDTAAALNQDVALGRALLETPAKCQQVCCYLQTLCAPRNLTIQMRQWQLQTY